MFLYACRISGIVMSDAKDQGRTYDAEKSESKVTLSDCKALFKEFNDSKNFGAALRTYRETYTNLRVTEMQQYWKPNTKAGYSPDTSGAEKANRSKKGSYDALHVYCTFAKQDLENFKKILWGENRLRVGFESCIHTFPFLHAAQKLIVNKASPFEFYTVSADRSAHLMTGTYKFQDGVSSLDEFSSLLPDGEIDIIVGTLPEGRLLENNVEEIVRLCDKKTTKFRINIALTESEHRELDSIIYKGHNSSESDLSKWNISERAFYGIKKLARQSSSIPLFYAANTVSEKEFRFFGSPWNDQKIFKPFCYDTFDFKNSKSESFVEKFEKCGILCSLGWEPLLSWQTSTLKEKYSKAGSVEAYDLLVSWFYDVEYHPRTQVSIYADLTSIYRRKRRLEFYNQLNSLLGHFSVSISALKSVLDNPNYIENQDFESVCQHLGVPPKTAFHDLKTIYHDFNLLFTKSMLKLGVTK